MKPALPEIESPWLTAEEAAAYMKFPSIRAFYRFLETHDIPHGRRGRVLLFRASALDAFIEQRLWTKRRVG